MAELAPVVPHSKIRTWEGRCLPTPLVVSKVVMAVILDPLVDSPKGAMQRQPYGMILPFCTMTMAPVVKTMIQSHRFLKSLAGNLHAAPADSGIGWASLSPGSTRTSCVLFGITWASKST